MSESPYVSAATAADFDDKVVDASRETPVMVDFWAEWCGPCRSLAPVLHEVVDELKGAVRLVTVDVDRETGLARGYGIRSLPTVKLFEGGEVVDELVGAVPASHVRAFLEPYIVRESERLADQAARLLEAGDREAANSAFEHALGDDPGNLKVRLRYARSMLDAGETARAAALLDAVPVAQSREAGVLRLKALIEFRELAGPETDGPGLEASAAEPSPGPEALRRLAARRVVEGDYAAAMDLQLRLMQQDRAYGDNAARKDLLSVFSLVDDPELVKRYQRRMAGLLY